MTTHLGSSWRHALIAAALLASYGTATAHHSFALYDLNERVTVEGIVLQYTWSQPHIWIDVMVPQPNGEAVRWGMESQSPGILSRRGWRHDSIKEGDHVIVILRAMKDGTPGGQVLKVTLSDGRVFTTRQGEEDLAEE